MDLKQRNWSIHLIRIELYWYQKMIYVWFWAKIGESFIMYPAIHDGEIMNLPNRVNLLISFPTPCDLSTNQE